jgi:hypothetical protein
VQIAALRRLLDNGRADGSCIQTVPGRGYRFAATVTPILEPRSGNGVEELIAEEREVLVPAPGQPEVTPPNALSLQRKRLRRASLVPVHKGMIFSGVTRRRRWRTQYGLARSRVSVVIMSSGIGLRARAVKPMSRLRSWTPRAGGSWGYADLRRANSTKLWATTADQM